MQRAILSAASCRPPIASGAVVARSRPSLVLCFTRSATTAVAAAPLSRVHAPRVPSLGSVSSCSYPQLAAAHHQHSRLYSTASSEPNNRDTTPASSSSSSSSSSTSSSSSSSVRGARPRRRPTGYAAAAAAFLSAVIATAAFSLAGSLAADAAPTDPIKPAVPSTSSSSASEIPASVVIDGVAVPVVREFIGQDPGDATKPRLVVVGAGWGATAFLKNLDPGNYNTVVISESNHFIFTPLLPEATTGTVEARTLQESIRKICHHSRAKFWQAEAYDVHPELNMLEVRTQYGDRFLVPYDKLVIAVGAQNATFGVPGVKENTHFLKTTADARKIRYEILTNLERASLPTTPIEKKKQLTSFVVAGGGPTGVEFAAGLYDFIHEDIAKHFPELLPFVKVSLIQSGEHILNAFAEAISIYAEKTFRRQNINLITNARVIKVEPEVITYKLKNAKPGENETVALPFGLCVWSTGIEKRDLTRRVTARFGHTNARAIEVDGQLRLKYNDDQDIYALGDCATIENPKIMSVVNDYLEKSGKSKLSCDDFELVAQAAGKKYPAAAVHLQNVIRLFDEYDLDRSGFLELDEIKKLLSDVNKKLTSLPATAQVASQQGRYLAKKFNKLEFAAVQDDVWQKEEQKYPPFKYTHLGSFSYIGGDEAVYDYANLGQGGLMVGLAWRGAYLSKQVSLRTRALLGFDWIKRYIFGRDITR
ncbi:hypothetical protein DFJ73DRAFT_954544 [Zopfochytrium polystomum]|nr:hypothetical protein DFJ73DRAFT_954544 [Zopfochytrium polystomum]